MTAPQADYRGSSSKPTIYGNRLYRSRLEAQWAYFFDRFGILYAHEPHRYHLEGGIVYVPDFFLPDPPVWFEVKGNIRQEMTAKPRALWQAVCCQGVKS